MTSSAWNVLFITADQWRGECLSALGHPVLQTPRLDALAADATLFRRHYAQATPCGPARASLYTGLYLHNHRVVTNGTPLDDRHANLAREVAKAGWEPALFGYTDAAADPRTLPADHPALRSREGILPGMVPVVSMGSDLAPWRAALTARGYEVGETALEVFRPRIDGDASTRGKTYWPALYSAEDSAGAFLTDAAIDYIDGRSGKPWFVHLSYRAPHPPFIAPEPYNTMYDAADVPAPVRRETAETEAAQHPWIRHFLFNQIGAPYTLGARPRDNLGLDEREWRQLRATYYGMISEIDAQVGRLLDHLRASGTYDRTLIVFTSDHGEHLGDHWMLSKFSYFDQTFHVPLIVRDPRAGPARGGTIEAFTESVDLMPTMLDWLGLEAPVACDGESLLPFCRGETVGGWRREAHAGFDFRNFPGGGGRPVLGLTPDQCGVTLIFDARYKYVHFAALPPAFFDRAEDPHEFRNLADDPAYQPLVIEYAQKLLSWRMTHDERTLANTVLSPDGVVERRGRRLGDPA